MRCVRLGDDEEAGGALVETVHDAGPLDAADPGKARAAVGDESVDERAGGVSGGGVHDEMGRLVDDDEVLVLVDDVKVDLLGRWRGGRGFGHADLELVAWFDPVRPVFYARMRRICDVTGANERLHVGAAQVLDALGQEFVEARAQVGRRHLDPDWDPDWMFAL